MCWIELFCGFFVILMIFVIVYILLIGFGVFVMKFGGFVVLGFIGFIFVVFVYMVEMICVGL